MKVVAIYSAIIAFGLLGLSGMISSAESPNEMMVGNWEEVAWEYEKKDMPGIEAGRDAVPEDAEGAGSAVHRAESWEFKKDGALCLAAPQQTTTANWCLKGRGHILQIDKGYGKEFYNIMQLNDSVMVLNFDVDLEVRGIAKLTFIKRNEKNNDL